MENGPLRVPIFGGARETGDTVGRSWKEVVKACVHHLPELRPNGIFSCIPVWEKLWLMLVLDFERLLSKVEYFSPDGVVIGQKLVSDNILFL